jgi:hypothetical protein
MMKSNDKMPASDLEALLPWYAAGTLESHEADEVEQALATDKELARRFALVREEMTETILLNEALGVPSARVMENLFRAIGKDRQVVRRTAGAGSGLGAWLADLFSPRALAFTASAAAIVVLLQAGYIAKVILEDRGGAASPGAGNGTFQTASAQTTTDAEPASYALVRFAPQATISDIARFLDAHGAAIVDGPRPGGAGGMFRVRVAETVLPEAELDGVIKEYQSAAGLVTFAAPAK